MESLKKDKNKVVLISSGDKYQLFVNDVKLNGIKLLRLEKVSNSLSEITVTFICHLETKEQL